MRPGGLPGKVGTATLDTPRSIACGPRGVDRQFWPKRHRGSQPPYLDPGSAYPALQAFVDPGDDEGYVERQSENQKADRIKERLVADFRNRLLDLVDWHHDREKLVAPVARRNIDDAPDISPASHIVDAGPRNAAILVRGNKASDHRVIQEPDLG